MATGGITFNGSSQYLEFNNKVVSGFPFTLVCWVAQASSGSSQFVLAQQQSNADRYAAAWLDANGTSKYGSLRNPGNSDNASKTTSPHPNSTLQLMVAVFTSTTSRTVYFGDNTGATSTTSMTDDVTSHDRITVGAWHYNSGGAGLFLNGTVAEAHIFNTALSSSDVTTLLTTTPESVSGWVDGWTLATNSDLTSIGGTRTLTAVGSPTTASLTLPYTRTTTPTITGPSGAAGAGTSTANIAENATTGPAFSTDITLGGGYPSLSGTNAANWQITNVSSTSWRVDPVAAFNFEASPTNPQVFVFNASASVAQTCTVTIVNMPEFSGTVPNQSGITGTSFSLDVSSYFGPGSFTYAIASGSLSGSGVSLNTSTGVLSGTLGTVGVYTVTVSAAGTIGSAVNSNSFTITVSATGTAPTVSSHPSNTTVTAGATASFTAAASGAPTPAVQWQENTGSWTNISGQTSTTLSLGVVGVLDSGRIFRAVFTNSSDSATTNSATLTVNAAAGDGTITSEPLKNNMGQLLGAGTLSWVGFRNSTTGADVLVLTSVAVNSSSVFTTGAQSALAIGQVYAINWKTSDGKYGYAWANAV